MAEKTQTANSDASERQPTHVTMTVADYERLTAENTRLRKALEEIRNLYENQDPQDDLIGVANVMHGAAEKALGREESDGE